MFTEFALSPGHWVLLAVCAALVGFAKTSVAGSAILAVPVMAMILPAERSAAILLPLLIVGDAVAIAYYHRHADWRRLLAPMPGTVLGVFVGWATLRHAGWTDTEYKRLVGALVLACIAARFVPWARLVGMEDPQDAGGSNAATASETAARPGLGVLALVTAVGITAGFSTMVANAAGPIWVVYVLACRLPKYALVGTGAWYFFLVNWFKIPLQYDLGNITRESLLLDALLVPAILIGALTGVVLLKRIPQQWFNRAVLWLAGAGAVKLLLS